MTEIAAQRPADAAGDGADGGVSPAAVRAARRTPAEMAALADQMRALLAVGGTVADAGRRLGITRDMWCHVSRRYGMAASPDVVKAAMGAASAKGHARRRTTAPPQAAKPAKRAAPRPPSKAAPPNPKLSPAQQRSVNIHKARIRNSVIRQFSRVPLDDADRLIAEAVAAGKVTRCPPAAPVELPINAGVFFK